jgi:hypothetical protein
MRNFAFNPFFARGKIKFMGRVLTRWASFLPALLLSFPTASRSATTCIGMPPLKAIHRVWGVVFFATGDRVTIANVSVLQGDKEIATQKTDDHGKFIFDKLKPGKYELRILVDGVPGVVGTEIVLSRVNVKSSQEIAVNINLTAINCSSFSLVDAKQFETELNPSDSE